MGLQRHTGAHLANAPESFDTLMLIHWQGVVFVLTSTALALVYSTSKILVANCVTECLYSPTCT